MKTIHNFAVALNDRHVEFTSGAERIAWFPAWENADRDLPHLNPQDIPIGTLEEPFEDFDDHWRITIYEDEGFVYVFEADHPQASTYPRSFRVPRDQYLMAWAMLLNDHNPRLSLD
jgi:hypothetical protein